jgi:hypothetical protein
MIAWIYAIGRVTGFGVAGGVRPALTLVLIGVMSRLGIGPDLTAPFAGLDHWIAIVVFGVLAIFESKFDNVPVVMRVQDRLLMPWRVVGGAVAAAATVGHGAGGVVLGLCLGAVVAWLGQSVKHGARPRQATGIAFALISLSEDLFAFGGVVATALISLLGYVFFGVNLWLLLWLGRRRRRKYRRPAAPRRGSAESG